MSTRVAPASGPPQRCSADPSMFPGSGQTRITVTRISKDTQVARKAKLVPGSSKSLQRADMRPDGSEVMPPAGQRPGRKPKQRDQAASVPTGDEAVSPVPKPLVTLGVGAPEKAKQGRKPRQAKAASASALGAESPIPSQPTDRPNPLASPPTEMPKPRRGRPPKASSDADSLRSDTVAPHSEGPLKPAAHWDRATDSVVFDWLSIEHTAATGGPNQAMAKLLLAARAEGANSRWPF